MRLQTAKPHQRAAPVPASEAQRFNRFNKLKSVRGDGGGENRVYVSENKRLAAQELFPGHRVFASRTNASACDVEEIVFYKNVNRDYNFLAVYGGATLAEAQRTLSAVRATGKFPQANIRKM